MLSTMQANTTCQSANADTAPTAPKGLVTLSPELVDYLRYPSNANQARLMLRGWFLCHALQQDSPEVLNPGTVGDNICLYELLDDYLSSIIEKGLPEIQ